jgi:xanthosine phosphorylase
VLGCEVVVLTNAAGSSTARAGQPDADHRSHQLAASQSMTGPNDDEFGPRFPPLDDAYDPALRQRAAAGDAAWPP